MLINIRRETIAFLIVRDILHQNEFAKALETLGVEWGEIFLIQFKYGLDDTHIGSV